MPFKKKTVSEVKNDVVAESMKDPLTKANQAANAAKAKEKASTYSIDKLTQEAATLSVAFSRGIADLTEKVASHVQIKEDLEAAIIAKEQDLQLLGDKEVLLHSLAEMVHVHEMTEAEHKAILAAQKAEIQEYQANLKKERDREQADFVYQVTLNRRNDQDAFLKSKKLQEEALQADLAHRAVDIAEREAELEDAEEELATLRTFHQNHDAVLALAVQTAVKEKDASLNAGFQVQRSLIAKDAEMASKLASQEIASLNHKVTELQGYLEALRTELTAERVATKDVAIAAVNAASGREALTSVKEVQASNASGGKVAK